jgi:4a-hydroxytetrahydrobiopterin dehydratase
MDDGIRASAFRAAEGVEDWRVVGDGAHARFRTGSFSKGARFAEAIGSLPGVDDHPPAIDIRPDAVTVRLITVADDWYGMSERDLELARRISAVARAQRLKADPSAIQSFLVIPGAIDTAAVMPFWKALLGYDRRPDSPEEDLVDPHDRNPAFWFEEMNESRPGDLGAIHVAVWIPYEEAESRVTAALAAGGRLVRDNAPSWWTLADPAGNEADVATTQGRD